MKKILVLLVTLLISLSIIACNPSVEEPVVAEPVVLGLTGAQYGGNINFPDTENLGSVATINNSTGQVAMRRPVGMTTRPLTVEEETSDSLYVYFNWDGSFAVMEEYTMTVDTSRTAQEVQSFNLKDFADLADYEVIVNYVRYKVAAGGNEYFYYEGDAMMESKNSTGIVLNNQTVVYDRESESFNIAIQRTDIDATLATYLSDNSDATLEVIGIQVFVIHRAKAVEYWDINETIIGSNSRYIYYDDNTNLSVASYHPFLSVGVAGVPQKTLYDWNPTAENPDLTYDYLGMFKMFYTLDTNVYPEDPDTVYLTQHNIEYGETKEPKIGVTYDLNPNAPDNKLYFSIPVQANSVSMYEDEREYFRENSAFRDMEFLVWVAHKYEDGQYKSNSNKTGSVMLNGRSNLIIDRVPDKNGNMIPVEIGDRIDLIGLFSIRYNQPVVNILNNQPVLHPETGQPIIVNMDFTMDWIYQGNVPIDLKGSTTDDVFVVEQSMYLYKNYKFDINKITFGRLDGDAQERRELMSDYLYRFYFEPNTPDFVSSFGGNPANLLPFTIRVSNNKLYNGNNVYNEVHHAYKNYVYAMLLVSDDMAPTYWSGEMGVYWTDENDGWRMSAVEDWNSIIFWYRGYYSRDIIGYSRTAQKDLASLEYWLGII